MRSLTASLLLVAPFVTGILASPTPDSSDLTATADVPGLVTQYFEHGESPVDTSFSIGHGAGSLQKRRHAECWDNYRTSVAGQDAYRKDCNRLVKKLGKSRTSQVLHTNGQVVFSTPSKICKITVRNQSSCEVVRFYDTAAGIAGRETLRRCPKPDQQAGWGYVGDSLTSQLVYIVEPYELAPPAYSPYCGDL